MELGALLDNTSYCVGATERGVGAWTYLTLTGAQIKSNWSTPEFQDNLLVGGCPNVPRGSKWNPVVLPSGQWIVVREHLGAVVPDVVVRAWPTMSEYRKTGRRPKPVVEPATSVPASVEDVVEDAHATPTEQITDLLNQAGAKVALALSAACR